MKSLYFSSSFPPPFITGKQSLSWLLDTLAEDWGAWLPEDTQETIRLYVPVVYSRLNITRT